MENCLQYDARHNFIVWLRIGSNLADINRFRRKTDIYSIIYLEIGLLDINIESLFFHRLYLIVTGINIQITKFETFMVILNVEIFD